MQIEKPVFMSIRQVAATGILSEHNIRLMEKQKKLPCIYAGRKCLINYPLFVESLNALSREAVTEE